MEQLSNYSQELSFRLQQDITKYQEVNQIFRKLDFVGYINQVYDLFHNIMNSEYQFTVQELKKLQEQEVERFDFIEKYQVNSLIFKSNFQVICNSINDYLWVLFFNKVQQEFSRDHQIHKSAQLNSDVKQENPVTEDIKQENVNIQTKEYQISGVEQSHNAFKAQQQANIQQMQQINQQIEIQQKESKVSIIREEIAKMAEQKQYINEVDPEQDSLSQKQKEDIIRESFIEDQQEKLNKYLNYESNVSYYTD